MEFTTENICGFLIRSRLLAHEEVRAMYQRWQGDVKDGANTLAQFSSWLVANKYVTEYQAALHVLAPAAWGWAVPVLTVSGLADTGLDRLWEKIEAHRRAARASGEFERRRRAQRVPQGQPREQVAGTLCRPRRKAQYRPQHAAS